jgi:hypothetical protein
MVQIFQYANYTPNFKVKCTEAAEFASEDVFGK